MSNTTDLAEKLKGILSEESLKLLLGSEALGELMADLKFRKKREISLEEELTNAESMITQKLNSIIELNKKVSNLESRESDIDNREKAVLKNEFEHRVRQEISILEINRGNEFKECLHLALRNTSIKKNMLETVTDFGNTTKAGRNLPDGTWDDGQSSHNSTVTTDKTITNGFRFQGCRVDAKC